MGFPSLLDLARVRALYAAGTSPHDLFAEIATRIDHADPAIFITRADEDRMAAEIEALLARAPEPNSLPLWGVPYAVKDNIDVAGMPITAACPAFAHVATKDAAVVARLRQAGAIMIGKTNLDQFATGLNGTRSPYGAPRSVFDPAYISGGSSSGSAVAVAAGLASFSLGTDTAGSGRVPAAFNNIVGIKPTSGLLSSRGVVPACRSLDCVSIFTLSVDDGARIRRIAQGFDPADPYSRSARQRPFGRASLRIGILAPGDREFFGDGESARLYEAAIARIGAATVEIDFAPFRETAALLYHGPWVAERLAAYESFGVTEDALDPSVASIILGGRTMSAADAFRGAYALEALRRRADEVWAQIDVLLLPTAPTIYRVDAMRADPIALNTRLGTYTNFFNLLNLSGIAVPAGFRSDGLPFGVTLAAPAFHDDALVPLAARMHHDAACGMGIDRLGTPPSSVGSDLPEDGRLRLAVVGAHLSGMPLNHELTALDATLEAAAHTTGDYRLFALPGTTPPKPGLVRAPGANGPGIAIEIWSFPPAAFGRFVERIPAPLGIGKVDLATGGQVSCFLCEEAAIRGAEEITAHGGWRAYMATLAAPV
ncbi:allophanate hydrolase [Flavisphingomonas formosensis]|uniref:allophanate hydrolase n=1 Tax=Flavisphingomonas formosensis TaxID=861534 RepID=UPI0012F8E22F|nr:allophanate hydrolase [Sphingomonas formosensis]